MGRKDVLAAFFTYLALLTQSLALGQLRRGRRRVLLVMVFLLCPLAVLAKFSAIVLVLLLAVHRIFAPLLARVARKILSTSARADTSSSAFCPTW